jgi:hypothetical protein
MSAKPTIKVTPVYGYGWSIGGEPRDGEPEPFTIRVEGARPLEGTNKKVLTGVVLDDRHEFQHMRVTLSQRHDQWTGAVNIRIESCDPAGQPSWGYGILAERPSPFEHSSEFRSHAT